MGQIQNKKKINLYIGIIFLLPFILIRFTAFATNKETWFFGQKIHIGCWFKESFGYDCPFCGLTRSAILTLYGEFSSAFQLNAFVPFFILGVLLLSFAISFTAFFKSYNLEKRLISFSIIYFGFLTILSFSFWLNKIIS
jgi:hypothetical protein